jgi:hypothetical protein
MCILSSDIEENMWKNQTMRGNMICDYRKQTNDNLRGIILLNVSRTSPF